METLHSDVNFNKWRSRSFVYGNKKNTKVDKVSLRLKKTSIIYQLIRYTRAFSSYHDFLNRPAAELWKMKFNAPIEHTPILYINVKRNMGTFKLNKKNTKVDKVSLRLKKTSISTSTTLLNNFWDIFYSLYKCIIKS
jgi:hypothetical protein